MKLKENFNDEVIEVDGKALAMILSEGSNFAIQNILKVKAPRPPRPLLKYDYIQ